MTEIQPKTLVQLISKEVGWRTNGIRRVRKLSGILPDPFNQVRECLCRQSWIGDQHQWCGYAADERNEIAQRPLQIGKNAGTNFSKRLSRDQNGFAVRGRLGNELRADIAGA